MKTLHFHLTIVTCLLTLGAAIAQTTSSSSSSNYSKRSGTMTISHSDGFQNFNVEMRGKIEITDDDKDIKSMSPDGYLEITKTVFGSRRTLVISSQGGSMKREYYEGRTSMPWEPEGRKWLAEIMPELLRTTTIAAESRVNRFYKQGGVNGVLNEINQMESDYVIQAYADLLMDINSIQPKEYASIVTKISSKMESDYYIAEFLQHNLDKFLQSKEATEAVFNASANLESDHYKTEVLKGALKSQPISAESIKIILAATDRMDSDHYKTEVLTTLLRQPNLTDQIIAEMINSTRSMDSDHYRTQVIQKALSQKNLSQVSYQRVLESLKDFDSDHYKTQVLTDLLSNKLPNDQIFNLVNLSNSIESDHYLTQVFQVVMKNQDLSDEAFKSLMERASNVDSDHYASQILRSALDQPGLDEAKLISVITAASNINSDHYITEVLTDAAPLVKNSTQNVKDAYRSAARKISSDTYYGRAMKAID
jgi:SOS response regulatory protein OraA/RecX